MWTHAAVVSIGLTVKRCYCIFVNHIANKILYDFDTLSKEPSYVSISLGLRHIVHTGCQHKSLCAMTRSWELRSWSETSKTCILMYWNKYCNVQYVLFVFCIHRFMTIENRYLTLKLGRNYILTTLNPSAVFAMLNFSPCRVTQSSTYLICTACVFLPKRDTPPPSPSPIFHTRN